MKIVVTGGAGFIGSHLCERLLGEGHDVICLDNLFTGSREHLPLHKRFEFIRHDVCEPFHVECDQIYHLACPASPIHYQRNPVRTIRTAVQGTLNALECARDVGARLLIASTSEIYGDPISHPQKETDWGNVNAVGPRSCYDEGKRAGESLAVAWASQYGTQVRIARIFNTYGPRMSSGDGRLIPNFVTQAMRKDSLTVYGTGKQTRSFCFVSDTVDGLVRLMAHEERELAPIVNIGNPDERTILSVAEHVTKRLGGTIVHAALPKDDPVRRWPDITRAREWLGWSPAVGFSDGLDKTIEFYAGRT